MASIALESVLWNYLGSEDDIEYILHDILDHVHARLYALELLLPLGHSHAYLNFLNTIRKHKRRAQRTAACLHHHFDCHGICIYCAVGTNQRFPF